MNIVDDARDFHRHPTGWRVTVHPVEPTIASGEVEVLGYLHTAEGALLYLVVRVASGADVLLFLHSVASLSNLKRPHPYPREAVL